MAVDSVVVVVATVVMDMVVTVILDMVTDMEKVLVDGAMVEDGEDSVDTVVDVMVDLVVDVIVDTSYSRHPCSRLNKIIQIIPILIILSFLRGL